MKIAPLGAKSSALSKSTLPMLVGSTFEVLLPVRVGPVGAITDLDA